MRFMGRPFAQNMHGGPDLRHILRKFTGLKEGVGENIPNTGRVQIHFLCLNLVMIRKLLGDLNDVILLLDI